MFNNIKPNLKNRLVEHFQQILEVSDSQYAPIRVENGLKISHSEL